MSTKQDGGPAFPMRFDYEGAAGNEPGMSLRDWFTGMALQGLIATPHIRLTNVVEDGPNLSASAYRIADDMLAARDK